MSAGNVCWGTVQEPAVHLATALGQRRAVAKKPIAPALACTGRHAVKMIARRARGSALQPCRQSQCYAPPGRLPQPEGELLAEIRQVITVQPTTAIARCTRLSGDGGAMSPIRFRSRRNTSASPADRKASGCASSLRWTAAPRGDLLGSDDRRRRHRPHPRSDDPERRTALRTGEPTAGGDRVAVRQRLAVHRRRNPQAGRCDRIYCGARRRSKARNSLMGSTSSFLCSAEASPPGLS